MVVAQTFRLFTLVAASFIGSVLFFVLLPFVTHAQFQLPGSETLLTLNPETPRAGETFTVRVEAYAYDINRAVISWEINGEIRNDFANEQSITLSAPALGTPLLIAARITEQGGRAHTVSTTITPNAVDIVIESDTRIPNFYNGRALPTAGSNVRLIAFPSIYTPNGTLSGTGDLIYTWKINNKVAKSGRGAQVLTTQMPKIGNLPIELIVETTDGFGRHVTYRTIEPIEGSMLFYEDNPLYGMSRNAIPEEVTLLNEEIAIRAEPYHVAKNIFTNAQYIWTMNNEVISNGSADPQAITLRRTEVSGSARISFSVRSLESLLQAASGSFMMYFQ